MKQHGDMYQRQTAMYPQMIFPHVGGPMMPNSQMSPNAANMHPSQYEYHFQQFPQSPISPGNIPGEYAVHMDGNQQQLQMQQGGYPSAGGKIQKAYGNRKNDNSRPVEEGDLFSENSNQNGGNSNGNGGGDDYNPHFRAAANSRPPEGMYMYPLVFLFIYNVINHPLFLYVYKFVRW